MNPIKKFVYYTLQVLDFPFIALDVLFDIHKPAEKYNDMLNWFLEDGKTV